MYNRISHDSYSLNRSTHDKFKVLPGPKLKGLFEGLSCFNYEYM